jgi:hypothetical protein
MNKSGLADSPFFAPVPAAPAATKVQPPKNRPPERADEPSKAADENYVPNRLESTNQDAMPSSNRDTTVSSNRGITTPSDHAATVETVRKAVRELGKEAATHRFTPEEKRAVMDLVYSYKGSGIRTSENEVARIAINYALEDYKHNGRNSILDRVLRALNE